MSCFRFSWLCGGVARSHSKCSYGQYTMLVQLYLYRLQENATAGYLFFSLFLSMCVCVLGSIFCVCIRSIYVEQPECWVLSMQIYVKCAEARLFKMNFICVLRIEAEAKAEAGQTEAWIRRFTLMCDCSFYDNRMSRWYSLVTLKSAIFQLEISSAHTHSVDEFADTIADRSDAMVQRTNCTINVFGIFYTVRSFTRSFATAFNIIHSLRATQYCLHAKIASFI